MKKSIQVLGAVLCLVGMAAAGAQPVSAEAARSSPQSLPVSSRLGIENVTLPGDESMGLVGGSYLLAWSPHWLAGPAVYGAATGHRGGLFVGGFEVAYRAPLGADWRLEAGLFAGGGGGAGAPVGGGLMLRPHLDLLWRVGEPLGMPGLWAGVSASNVRFPDGRIRSSQAGLVLMVDGDFVHSLPSSKGPGLRGGERGGMGFDRISVSASQYRPRDGREHIGLVGFRLEHGLSTGIYWGLEAAGASSGGAGGYAEVLGVLGGDIAIGSSPLSLGARAAVGMGGGGAVPTEGGLLAKAGLSMSWRLSRDLSLSLEGGAVTAPQGSFRARYAQAALTWDLDHPVPGPTPFTDNMEWDLAFQQVGQAARNDGSRRSFQSIGLQVRRALNDNFYISGQAHSAFNGQAGAYSMGLVGAGAETPRTAGGWSLGAELLLGAAGGGGVYTEGGAVVQPMLKLNWDASPRSRLHAGFGRIRSLKGELDSPVVELAWGLAFGVPTR